MISELLVSICTVIAGLFTSLDSVYLDSWSILDILLALSFMGSTVWFISEVMSTQQKS